MKNAGYALIALCFVAGSLISVFDAVQIRWSHYAVAIVLGVVGAVLVQLSIRRHTQADAQITKNLEAVGQSLQKILEGIGALKGFSGETEVYEIHGRIDDTIAEHIATFVEARDTIGHAYGLQTYADVMSVFASGERAINRAWSASADGYVDEVRICLERAGRQFGDALARLPSDRRPA